MPLITFDILKVYQDCNGDQDMFARTSTKKEQELFVAQESAIWWEIDATIQDINLVSKKLCSNEFTSQALAKLKTNCDEKSFAGLTSRIPFYQDFQRVAEIISIIKNKISIDTDFAYTRFETLSELQKYIDDSIIKSQLCDFEQLGKINTDFSPTGLYQELALDNGWGEEFLSLAAKFDILEKDIHSTIVESSSFVEIKQRGIIAKLLDRFLGNHP